MRWKASPRDPGKYSGRARNNKTAVFPSARPLAPGDIVQVVAEAGHMWGVMGRVRDAEWGMRNEG